MCVCVVRLNVYVAGHMCMWWAHVNGHAVIYLVIFKPGFLSQE